MEGVRTAASADLGRCTELLAASLAAARGVRGGAQLVGGEGGEAPARSPDPAELVSRWAVHDDATLLVGTFEGEVVGLAAGTLGDRRPDGGRLGRIECCYVEPAARSVGVGAALVATLLGWFETRGCDGVDAYALPGDRGTKQLFEAAGFKARLLVLHRSPG